MPEHGDDFRTWTVKIRPASSSPTTRPSRASARAGRADYVYSYKRFADPAVKSPAWSWLETYESSGLSELRQQALAKKQPFDYDKPIEGLRRWTATPCAFAWPRRGRASSPARWPAATCRRGGARGGRGLRRQDPRPPGGHRAVQAGAVAAQQLHRARAQPRIPRAALRRRAGARRCRGPGHPGAPEGPAAAADRPRGDLHHRGEPAALAQLPAGCVRPARATCRPNSSSRRCPAGRWRPTWRRRASAGSAWCVRPPTTPSSTWKTRWSAATSRTRWRCAAPSGWPRPAHRDPACAPRPGDPAQSASTPHTYAYDPAFKSENGEYNLPRAKALLQMYGYVDRDGDGWRERPTASRWCCAR
jgi:hypothetical protein